VDRAAWPLDGGPDHRGPPRPGHHRAHRQVLFDSGSAEIKPNAPQLLDALARLLKTQVRNPIQVEGNTDNVP
jgi:outer membrane protein OmpA-like peptidoglycan-associated protein